MKQLLTILLIAGATHLSAQAQTTETYAEKLGFPKGKKVIILHVDDAGMSYESNAGMMNALDKGIANSTSVMMPCGWVPQFFDYLKKKPDTDAGIHLARTPVTDANLQQYKTKKYIELLNSAKPGLTYIIMHCTASTPTFDQISNSGQSRKGDMLAMMDPALKSFTEKEGIIITNWKDGQTVKLSLAESFTIIFSYRKAYLLICFAMACQALINYGCNAWVPTFINRTYGKSPAPGLFTGV